MTNYQYIKQMSNNIQLTVEEMAEYFADMLDCNFCKQHIGLSDNLVSKDAQCDNGCILHCREWLDSECIMTKTNPSDKNLYNPGSAVQAIDFVKNAPLFSGQDHDYTVPSHALNIIMSQKTQIEQLNKKVEELSEALSGVLRIKYTETKSDAYKEFGNKIKAEIESVYNNNLNVLLEHMSKPTESRSDEFIANAQGKLNTLWGLDNFIDHLLNNVANN